MEELVFDGRSPLCSSCERPAAKPMVCAPYSCSFLSFTQVIRLHSNLSQADFFFPPGKKKSAFICRAKNFSYRKPAAVDAKPRSASRCRCLTPTERHDLQKRRSRLRFINLPLDFGTSASEQRLLEWSRLQKNLFLSPRACKEMGSSL